MAKIIYFLRQGETHPVDAESPRIHSDLAVVSKTLNTDITLNRIRGTLNCSPAVAVTLTRSRKEELNSLFSTLSHQRSEHLFQWWCT